MIRGYRGSPEGLRDYLLERLDGLERTGDSILADIADEELCRLLAKAESHLR